jgi:hypothetical protein
MTVKSTGARDCPVMLLPLALQGLLAVLGHLMRSREDLSCQGWVANRVYELFARAGHHMVTPQFLVSRIVPFTSWRVFDLAWVRHLSLDPSTLTRSQGCHLNSSGRQKANLL